MSRLEKICQMTAGDLEKGMDGCVEGVASLYFFTVPFCGLLRLGRASVQGGRREMCGLSNPRGCCPPYISLPVSRQSSMENEPVQGGAGFPPKGRKLRDFKKETLKSGMYLNGKINGMRNKSLEGPKSGDRIWSMLLIFQFQPLPSASS